MYKRKAETQSPPLLKTVADKSCWLSPENLLHNHTDGEMLVSRGSSITLYPSWCLALCL